MGYIYEHSNTHLKKEFKELTTYNLFPCISTKYNI
jgi:hypothetical protein